MTDLAEAPWTDICASIDLAPGEMREFTLPDGSPILLLRTDGQVFACVADCPHQDTPLIDGVLDRAVLTCPTHLWQWDLETGDALGIAELPLPMHAVREADGRVYVGPARTRD
jgi:toluene monooxygenase system ferredoxin subunit